ncbi:hypothetical protein PC129_g18106 [Phytophthora cactorum]|uniref:Uncharacterized protein n=1 Tax=Phytophthora cactorum TaxID=29920 RepID=A0A329RNZ2_9STRA|nr:hypothetical protein Pcac1_g11083 [Phytophthora cactorum]KAG2805662.1 hypothetical protein PC112_g18182 [Phytophthora cactorum]KAG2807286.1 hypothetical protein PC111_g16992 [Phytophthora cactorum]KAG2845991.1 hypothetical protein PC113_g18062 [Phytophthora cactorum]KAG2880928.1 hypothetical protein PC114_g21830 [Phytophthora cactorum]
MGQRFHEKLEKNKQEQLHAYGKNNEQHTLDLEIDRHFYFDVGSAGKDAPEANQGKSMPEKKPSVSNRKRSWTGIQKAQRRKSKAAMHMNVLAGTLRVRTRVHSMMMLPTLTTVTTKTTFLNLSNNPDPRRRPSKLTLELAAYVGQHQTQAVEPAVATEYTDDRGEVLRKSKLRHW